MMLPLIFGALTFIQLSVLIYLSIVEHHKPTVDYPKPAVTVTIIEPEDEPTSFQRLTPPTRAADVHPRDEFPYANFD